MASIEEHIRRAMEDGKFENLPGKGKPLNLDEDPHEDPAWRMAHHVLRSNGFTLPWIETRQEIEQALETARTALVRSWEWRQRSLKEKQPHYQVESEWQRALDAFQKQIAAINKRIFSYNLEAPSEQFQMFPINVDKEVKAVLHSVTD